MFVDYEDPDISVMHLVIGGMDNNVYFVTCKTTGSSLMIDAPTSPELLIKACEDLNVKRVAITHGHHDHIGAITQMRAAGYKVAVGKNDIDRLPEYDSTIDDGDILKVGEVVVEAMALPGHTQGSICFAVQNKPLFFSGDTLFPGGPGATHFPGGDFNMIMQSIDRIFTVLPNETLVFPGHGKSTTIGDERLFVDDWRARGW